MLRGAALRQHQFAVGLFPCERRGFSPRLQDAKAGIAYTDDCIDLSFTWRRDYITTGDAKRGNAFQFSFALRNLGIR